MSERTNDEIVSSALDRVNEIRAEFGVPAMPAIPCGEISGESCPIARALTFGNFRATVTGEEYGFSDVHVMERRESRVSSELVDVIYFNEEPEIGEFVRAFDDGDLPEFKLAATAAA